MKFITIKDLCFALFEEFCSKKIRLEGLKWLPLLQVEPKATCYQSIKPLVGKEDIK